MARQTTESVESILSEIDPARRKFLQRSLLAGGAIAVAAPASTVLAQQPGDSGGRGKGSADGQGGFRGKGKGTGGGKGKGTGGGKGKGPGGGKGKGSGQVNAAGPGNASGNRAPAR